MEARNFNIVSFAFGLAFVAIALSLGASRLGWSVAGAEYVVWIVVLVSGVAMLANALLRRGLRHAAGDAVVEPDAD